MKKLIIVEPIIKDENVVVEFSNTFNINKQIVIHVPNGYLAVVYINEKLLFKINPIEEKKILDYGKTYLNKDCRIAFIKTKSLPSMAWGFGNIQVNNERLKEAYRVGANGKYNVDISEIGKLINSFENINITIDMIRSRTISVIKNIGTAVLGSYFAKTNNSVFEISSLTNDIRQELLSALVNEVAFTGMGLKLKDLTVDGVYVPEEDLDLIRKRINTSEDTVSNQVTDGFDTDLMYEKLSQELAEQLRNEIKNSEIRSAESVKAQIQESEERSAEQLRNEIHNSKVDISEQLRNEIQNSEARNAKQLRNEINESEARNRETLKNQIQNSEARNTEKIKNVIKNVEAQNNKYSKNDLAEELENSKKMLLEELNNKMNSQIEELEKSLVSEFDEKMQEMLPLNSKATENYINEIKITAENLIKSANDDEDLIPGAAIIYSNVESNLRTKFNLNYEKEHFVIDYKDYQDIADKAIIDGRYLLKRKNSDGTFSLSMPRVIDYDLNGNPLIVEMAPIVRFLKAGLSNEESKKATEIWTILNKIRHNSADNEKILKDLFQKANISRKEYLLQALEFYKNKGLYTKD